MARHTINQFVIVLTTILIDVLQEWWLISDYVFDYVPELMIEHVIKVNL